MNAAAAIGSISTAVAPAAVLLAALPFLLSALYLLVLAGAARFYRPAAAGGRTLRLAVLVPAHDEELLVARSVRSLVAQRYPPALRRVIVIADNCHDGTARAAAAAGAVVLERRDAAALGKGHALRWAMDRLLRETDAPDAFVVVDADSVADPGLLAALNDRLVAGCDAVQAEYLVLRESRTTRGELAGLAILLFHRVRMSGKAALGLPVNLVGNGMAFSADLLRRHPWDAFLGAEDLQYSISLRMAGVRPAFTGAATVYGPLPGSHGSVAQRMRWEGGRFHLMRGLIGRLAVTAVRRRDLNLLDAAVELSVLPLTLLTLGTLTGTTVSVGLVALGGLPAWTAAAWLSASAALVLHVVVGLWAARAPAATWAALAAAPWFVAWKLLTYRGLLKGFDPQRWERSERGGDLLPAHPSAERRRALVAGVPIDEVSLDEALDRMTEAAREHRRYQVATINLDFLTRARKDAELSEILRTTELNTADGAPVLLLARFLGLRLTDRVTGADLLPRLAERAARDGHSLFLLGGAEGAADDTAQALRRQYPDLRIAGTYAPPISALESLDDAEIIRRIEEARPDFLLVAFGNPKQEKWIRRHRDLLPPLVAIGVGGCFEILSGRIPRAPAWMRASGLEWGHRLRREPRRLGRRYLVDALWLPSLLATTVVQRVVLQKSVVTTLT